VIGRDFCRGGNFSEGKLKSGKTEERPRNEAEDWTGNWSNKWLDA